jgi:hypothetical protein
MQRPEVLVDEYTRRLEVSGSATTLEFERRQVTLAPKRVKGQEDRLTDAYVNKAMDLRRYKEEMVNLRSRQQELEQAAHDIEDWSGQEQASRRALEHLERFCHQIAKGSRP